MDLTITLISHTNSGKTSLARTLLCRDVGEQRDREHVTQQSEEYLWAAADGHHLLLWDTPGLGSTPLLLKRMALQRGPVQWFMSQVWDRLRDPGLYYSQLALRTAVEQADVLLYTINVSESPAAAGYVSMELSVLARIGKPVIALLNYTGPPRPSADGGGDPGEEEWRQHLTHCPAVKAVLPLDAFFRCWVQESVLMDSIAALLPAVKQDAFASLTAAWREDRTSTFRQAMNLLGTQLVLSATDHEPAPREKLIQRIGISRGGLDAAYSNAQTLMLVRLETRSRETVDRLISLHGIDGRSNFRPTAGGSDFGIPVKVHESVWGAVGAALTGAAAGLAADLHTGGLGFGGGTVAGFFLGGAGTWLLAKGYNLARGEDDAVRWTLSHFLAQAEVCLVTYLAVAHHGRGRGEWQETGHPPHWLAAARTAIASQKSALESIWKRAGGKQPDAPALTSETAAILTRCAYPMMASLYPAAGLDWLRRK